MFSLIQLKEEAMSELFKDLVIDSESPSGLRWADTARYQQAGKPAGTLQSNPRYWVVWVNKRLYRVHRVIMCLLHDLKYASCPVVDHIDGDGSNNSIGNLRLVTHAQNSANMKTPTSNTTGVKGVSYDKRRNKYRAYVTVHGKQHTAGRFDTLEEAAEAVKKLREELHGQYARQ
ncbi:hypothetical protein ebrios_18 [Escherichia phage Ebrios]|uniref:HNH endonuclease n=1 Tax=Escherichia phage Ebrios TaxID=2099356 RepID=A0A2P1CKX5_9CAUD|nr:HNH endonuclease [Escherichia phage Ebrios]AVJ51901.1 hypothetical protein ebrios_18 [Escherichia phage Ebrios]